MSKRIYLSGGSKGGVGKSLVSMAVIDYLQERGETVLLIESDTSNPDVYKCYQATTETAVINLETADGWIKLVNTCDSKPDSVIVINTQAANSKSVTAYSETLTATLEELKRELVTLWSINTQRDSLALLNKYLDAVPNSLVHVVRNLHYGDVEDFDMYEESKARTAVEARGGKVINLPKMADRVAKEIYSDRFSISAASKDMPIGNRAEVQRWRRHVARAFEGIIA